MAVIILDRLRVLRQILIKRTCVIVVNTIELGLFSEERQWMNGTGGV